MPEFHCSAEQLIDVQTLAHTLARITPCFWACPKGLVKSFPHHHCVHIKATAECAVGMWSLEPDMDRGGAVERRGFSRLCTIYAKQAAMAIASPGTAFCRSANLSSFLLQSDAFIRTPACIFVRVYEAVRLGPLQSAQCATPHASRRCSRPRRTLQTAILVRFPYHRISNLLSVTLHFQILFLVANETSPSGIICASAAKLKPRFALLCLSSRDKGGKWKTVPNRSTVVLYPGKELASSGCVFADALSCALHFASKPGFNTKPCIREVWYNQQEAG